MTGRKSLLWLVPLCVLLLAEHNTRSETANKPDVNMTSPAACCEGTTGNVNATGTVDLSDLALLIRYLTVIPTAHLPCLAEANVNSEGTIDLSDLSLLIGYLTRTPTPILPNCPASMFTFAQRSAAFDAIDSVEASLGAVTPDSLARALLAFLNGRSEFEAAGINDGVTVWARFDDGRLLIIPNNRFPDSDSILAPANRPQPPRTSEFVQPKRRFASWQEIERARAIERAPSAVTYEMPHSVTAFLGNTLSPWCFKYALDHVGAMLTSGGYAVTYGNTVEDLLAILNYGVFYIDAHGGSGNTRDGRTLMSIWTGTDVTDQNDNLYDDMLNSNELVYMKANDLGFAECEDVERYAFTSDFVAQYMSFTPNSFVYISACNSENAGLKSSFAAAGASVYAGWTEPVSDVASNRAGLYMIERMLGTSRSGLPSYAAPEENPRQRPFGITMLWTDMVARHFERENDPLDPVRLVISHMQGGFEMLAPSLRYVQVLPRRDTMEMTGFFGSDPGSKGHVKINGIEQQVYSWEPTIIKCHIPEDGPGSAGPITVEIEQITGPAGPKRRTSNPINLTDWRGTLTYSETDAGSLTMKIHVDLHIRADVHSFREFPHLPAPATNQFIVFGGVTDVIGSANASGQWIYPVPDSDPPEVITYDRTGVTPVGWLGDPDPFQGFLYQGSIDGSIGIIELFMQATAYQGMTETETSSLYGLLSTTDLSVTTMQEVYLPPVPPFYKYFTLNLLLDDQATWAIQGMRRDAVRCCSKDLDNPDIKLRMEWDDIPATFAPDNTTPR